MKKNKLLCLLLCVVMVAGLAIPGSLAVATASASSDLPPVCDCGTTTEEHLPSCALLNAAPPEGDAAQELAEAPVLEPETPADPEAPAEEPVDPETPETPEAPVDPETPEVPETPEAPEAPAEPENPEAPSEEPADPEAPAEEPSLYAQLMAAQTMEQVEALVSGLTEEEGTAFMAALSPEEQAALTAHLQSLSPVEEAAPPKTVTFTAAGPFLPPVSLLPAKARPMRAPTRAANQPDDGVVTSKTVTVDGNGNYTLRLESYVTGATTTTTETKTTPVDIVLVLDQSGSMAYGFDGKNANYADSRQKAMKDAVNGFIEAVNDKYKDDADHRMAIVTYGSNVSTLEDWTSVDANGKAKLQSDITSLPSPSGATNVAAGMQRAETLMGSGYNPPASSTERQKVVIVFTDGVPTTSSDFDTGVADRAIASAKNLKDSGVTVYTIGIFNGAEPGELYGLKSEFKEAEGVEGANGYFWKAHSWFDGGDGVTSVSIPAGNRFLNYLSSNVPTAESLGLERKSFDFVYHYEQFTITRSYEKKLDNYYLTADSSDSLNTIFKTISSQIQTGGASVTLGTTTVVKDVISDYFQLPDGTVPSNITVKTAECNSFKANGDPDWTNELPASYTTTIEGKTVSVTGFDFSDNYVGRDTITGDVHPGKKLIIEIPIEPREGFIGGNDVPTNGAASGIYTQQDGAEVVVENFNQPTANVPIEPPTFKTNDKTIYEGNSTDASSLYDLPDTTGWQYDYVTVTSAVTGVTGDTVSPTDCTDYSVTVTYKPKTNGDTAVGTANPMTGSSETGTATVHVLKPTVNVTVNDVEAAYGETYTLGERANAQVASVTWTDKTAGHTATEAEDTAPYEAKDLTIAYVCGEAQNGSFTVPDHDVNVTVKVMKGDTQLSGDYVTITTTCNIDGADCTTPDHDGIYTVHVTTCKLTIEKSAGSHVYDANDTFIFDVKQGDETIATVTLKKGESVTITGLKKGTYTVHERTADTRYVTQDDQTVDLKPAGYTATFTNTVKEDKWLTSSETVKNEFTGKSTTTEGNG